MTIVSLDQSFLTDELNQAACDLLPLARKSLEELKNGSCLGSDFTGWYDYPKQQGFKEVGDIKDFVQRLDVDYDTVLVIGIGGSYVGTRAVADSLNHTFQGQIDVSKAGYRKQIIYTGHHLSDSEVLEVLDLLGGRLPIVNVISKSGTTTEPGIAFRIVRKYLEERFGEKEACRRIIVTTDAEKGALRQLSSEKGYHSFVIPSSVGGRYSVLTPVGVLPLALSGFDVANLMDGADQVFSELENTEGGELNHPVLSYAAARIAAYRAGKKIELMAYSDPKLRNLVEWWKQLFGESEGKDGKGLFPSGLAYTTDLHSLGQMIQSGERTLIETFLTFKEEASVSTQSGERRLSIPSVGDNYDGLGYLESRAVSDVNHAAIRGTKVAHFDGGVPCLSLEVRRKDETGLGALMAFFEASCAVSSALLGVNPFDQPGVEDYKSNLFALLGKPGYEELGRTLRERF